MGRFLTFILIIAALIGFFWIVIEVEFNIFFKCLFGIPMILFLLESCRDDYQEEIKKEVNEIKKILTSLK